MKTGDNVKDNEFSITSFVFSGLSFAGLPIIFGSVSFTLALMSMIKKEQLRLLALGLSVTVPIISWLLSGYIMGVVKYG